MALIRSVQGIQNHIYPDKPPTSFKDAMSRPNSQEWADENALATVMLPKGAKVLGTTTQRDYKIDNGVFSKRKVHM